jgi:hypothetical protein
MIIRLSNHVEDELVETKFKRKISLDDSLHSLGFSTETWQP